MIDPYAETYCDSIIGDISQIYQSCLSGYEYTVSYCDHHDFSIFPYLESDLPSSYTRFYNHFTASLSAYPFLESDSIELILASQFTRMFPFKVLKDTNLAFKFLLHGVDPISKIMLVNQTLNEVLLRCMLRVLSQLISNLKLFLY